MKLTRFSLFFLAIITSGWSSAAEAISSSDLYCMIFYCEPEPEPEYDFVVVGAGSGGGTVASRLAHLGHSVLLIDAGGDPADRNPTYPIPANHPFASEKPGRSWSYYVEHYSDPAKAARNSNAMCRINDDPGKRVSCIVQDNGNCDCPSGTSREGIFYPRGTGIGGSSANNAMINVLPKNSDWDSLAQLTGDDSWSASNINSTYLPILYDWASIEKYEADWLVNDVHGQYVQEMVESAVSVVNPPNFDSNKSIVENLNDNNLLEASVANEEEGMWVLPVAHNDGFRASVRERILASACMEDPLNPDGLSDGQRENKCKSDGLWDYDNDSPLLVVQYNSLVTKVLFDSQDSKKATGVEYVVAEGAYKADQTHKDASGQTRDQVFAAKEIILAAGAYNTPQLLMLSGIGDPEVFNRADINISLRHALPGVGRNLQDRYEVGMVYEAPAKLEWIENCFSLLSNILGEGCVAYLTGAKALNTQSEKSVLSTNLSFTSILTKSSADKPEEDLHIFGLVNQFTGYFDGYSAAGLQPKRFTWVVLKGHNENRGGVVTLKTDSPFDRPSVNYNSFEDGNKNTLELGGNPNSGETDLAGVLAGVKLVRDIVQNAEATYGTQYQEVWPGRSLQSDEELKQAIRDRAWGHHAFSTAAIGREEDTFSVLDSDFRVRGIENLRVVDASVFPRHVGTFPVLAVYIMAEKAAHNIDKAN